MDRQCRFLVRVYVSAGFGLFVHAAASSEPPKNPVRLVRREITPSAHAAEIATPLEVHTAQESEIDSTKGEYEAITISEHGDISHVNNDAEKHVHMHDHGLNRQTLNHEFESHPGRVAPFSDCGDGDTWTRRRKKGGKHPSEDKCKEYCDGLDACTGFNWNGNQGACYFLDKPLTGECNQEGDAHLTLYIKVVGASCATFPCVGGYLDKSNKADLSCASEECSEADQHRCCDGASCSAHPCPDGYDDAPNKDELHCATGECGEGDTNTCCVPEDPYTEIPDHYAPGAVCNNYDMWTRRRKKNRKHPTVELCKEYCDSDDTCSGFNWNDNPARGKRDQGCYFMGAWLYDYCDKKDTQSDYFTLYRKKVFVTTTTSTALPFYLEGLTVNVTGAPNFIVFMMDDAGFGDLSYTGVQNSPKTPCPADKEGFVCNPEAETPQMDQMAREGIVFRSFYSGAVICTPSRAAALTGRYPIRVGTYPLVYEPTSLRGFPSEEVTIAEVLRSAGYETHMVGKWHLGHTKGHLPHMHGFNTWKGMPWSHNMCPCECDDTNICNLGLTNSKGCPAAGSFSGWPKDNKCKCEGGKYNKYPPCPSFSNDAVVNQSLPLHVLTQTWVDLAKEFITEHRANNPDKPYFLYMSFLEPHFPMFLAEKWAQEAKASGEIHSLYAATMKQVDDAIGQVLEAVRGTNTAAIVTSDNGPSLAWKDWGGSPGDLRCGKGSTWDGGVRVPGIFWYPEKSSEFPPRVLPEEAMGTALDIMPTFLSLANLSPVWAKITENRDTDGEDLTPILAETKSRRQKPYFYYSGFTGNSNWNQQQAPTQAARNENSVEGVDAVRFDFDAELGKGIRSYKVLWRVTISQGHNYSPDSFCWPEGGKVNDGLFKVFDHPLIFDMESHPTELDSDALDNTGGEYAAVLEEANRLKTDHGCNSVEDDCYHKLADASMKWKMFAKHNNAKVQSPLRRPDYGDKFQPYMYDYDASLLEVANVGKALRVEHIAD